MEVTRALELNRDIGYSSVPFQLEELIVKPLRVIGSFFPSSIIVLDALDECKDKSSTSIILSSLARYIVELPQLKILITSRPEQNIRSAFNTTTQLGGIFRPLILHSIELGIVQRDIELYLSWSLPDQGGSQPRQLLALRGGHPFSRGALERLFIFAATSVNFIEDQNYSSPRDQLANLLQSTSMVAKESTSPHRYLDELYTQVLSHAFPHTARPLADRLRMILGSLVLLRDPLSAQALELLLKLRPKTVRETLVHLHSVIVVPENDIKGITLLHPSFFDFITDPTRCRNPNFVVDTLIRHTQLACACLDSMKCLRQDICEIKNPFLLDSEVDDLPSRITECIPTHLQYASRYRAFHFTNASVTDVLLDLMNEFCFKYLLFWVEVCSLLGKHRSALIALHDARKFLVVSRSGI